MSQREKDFYLRYYVGHKGKFGHEFLEFEVRPDGKELLLDWTSLTRQFRLTSMLRFGKLSDYLVLSHPVSFLECDGVPINIFIFLVIYQINYSRNLSSSN